MGSGERVGAAGKRIQAAQTPLPIARSRPRAGTARGGGASPSPGGLGSAEGGRRRAVCLAEISTREEPSLSLVQTPSTSLDTPPPFRGPGSRTRLSQSFQGQTENSVSRACRNGQLAMSPGNHRTPTQRINTSSGLDDLITAGDPKHQRTLTPRLFSVLHVARPVSTDELLRN